MDEKYSENASNCPRTRVVGSRGFEPHPEWRYLPQPPPFCDKDGQALIEGFKHRLDRIFGHTEVTLVDSRGNAQRPLEQSGCYKIMVGVAKLGKKKTP